MLKFAGENKTQYLTGLMPRGRFCKVASNFMVDKAKFAPECSTNRQKC